MVHALHRRKEKLKKLHGCVVYCCDVCVCDDVDIDVDDPLLATRGEHICSTMLRAAALLLEGRRYIVHREWYWYDIGMLVLLLSWYLVFLVFCILCNDVCMCGVSSTLCVCVGLPLYMWLCNVVVHFSVHVDLPHFSSLVGVGRYIRCCVFCCTCLLPFAFCCARARAFSAVSLSSPVQSRSQLERCDVQ